METMMMKMMALRSARSAESDGNKIRKLGIMERRLNMQEAELEENKRIRIEEREEARLIRQEERDERIRADAHRLEMRRSSDSSEFCSDFKDF